MTFNNFVQFNKKRGSKSLPARLIIIMCPTTSQVFEAVNYPGSFRVGVIDLRHASLTPMWGVVS